MRWLQGARESATYFHGQQPHQCIDEFLFIASRWQEWKGTCCSLSVVIYSHLYCIALPQISVVRFKFSTFVGAQEDEQDKDGGREL